MARHVQTLDPGELVDLAALGLISEQPHAADDVVAFVKAAGGGTFSPTSEIILERLWRLLQLGHLVPTHRTKGPNGDSCGPASKGLRFKPQPTKRHQALTEATGTDPAPYF